MWRGQCPCRLSDGNAAGLFIQGAFRGWCLWLGQVHQIRRRGRNPATALVGQFDMKPAAALLDQQELRAGV